MDNRLTFMDQTVFDLLRATGTGKLLQFVWIYDHPVDFDELRRFHRDFGYGMAGRLIERSALPVPQLSAVMSSHFSEFNPTSALT